MIPAVRIICFIILLSAFSFRAVAEDFTNAVRASTEPTFPGIDWERESNGLSPETIRGVDAFVRTLDTTGLMVVQHGRVIYEYGDVTRLSYPPTPKPVCPFPVQPREKTTDFPF